MRSLHSHLETLAGRGLALLLALLTGLIGCPPNQKPLGPEPGLPQYQELAMIRVPGAQVNAIGGNLHLRRVDLSIDTRLGTREVGAVWDSARGSWLWDFDVSYDGATFRDPTGAVHDTSTLPLGSAIPGTVWVVVDGDTLKTKGGLAHQFGSNGRLVAVHWTSSAFPRLTMTSQTIAGQPRTTAIRQCTAPSACTDVFSIGYDAAGRVVSIVDRAGRIASFSWDAEGRLSAARDALDTAKGWPGLRYEYDGTSLTALTNSEGERVEFRYSASRVRRVLPIGADGPTYEFAYEVETDGLYRTRVTDPTGHETRYRYDAERRLREVEIMGTGELTERFWEGRRVASQILPSGVATSWTWAGDDVATRLEASGNVTTYSYAPNGVNREAPFERPIASITDSVGLVEQRSYDAQGRLLSITNGAGEATSFGYGSSELVETRTLPDGVVLSYAEYGEHGHAARTGLGGEERVRTFDAVGNLLEGPEDRDPLPPGLVSRAFDADRNLAGLLLADLHPGGVVQSAQWITIEHRSDGRRTAIRRPGGGDHELGYDPLGRLVEERERVDGQWRVTRHERDAAGRPTAVERPNGMREEIAWDAAGRVAQRRALRHGVLEGTVEFGYEAGQLASVEDSLRGTESYFYDPAGRPLSIRHPDGETLFVGWDARSRKTREIYVMPDWSILRELEFGYDLADREVTTSDQHVPVLERTFQGGRLVQTSYGNGLARSYAYDPATGLLAGSQTLDGTLQTLEETSIEREVSNGLVPALLITATTTTHANVPATTEESYGLAAIASGPYEDSGTRVWTWESEAGFQSFAYDHLGNMTATGFGIQYFAYNAEGNRLLSANPHGTGTIAYTWDAAGFATSRAGKPITWTATGRMASYGTDVELEWDMLGRLVSSRVGSIEARFRFGGRVKASAAGTPASIDLGEVSIDLASGEHLYRHFDFRENVKFLSDDAGRVVAHYRYSPYGVDEVFGSDEDPVRFVGRAEIGDLMILGFRIYDPAVGRFLSPDPIVQGVNQHGYALGNPVLFVDPDGLHELGLGDILVAVAIGVLTNAIYAAFPQFAVMYSIFILLAYLIAQANADAATAAANAAQAGAGGQGAASSRGSDSGSAASCAPASLTAVPDADPLFLVLMPIQLGLALLLLRRRRRARSE